MVGVRMWLIIISLKKIAILESSKHDPIVKSSCNFLGKTFYWGRPEKPSILNSSMKYWGFVLHSLLVHGPQRLKSIKIQGRGVRRLSFTWIIRSRPLPHALGHNCTSGEFSGLSDCGYHIKDDRDTFRMYNTSSLNFKGVPIGSSSSSMIPRVITPTIIAAKFIQWHEFNSIHTPDLVI
jgi:hypothetical protein